MNADMLKLFWGELLTKKRNLILGSRLLELDGQTPTSYRFCCVFPACPSKTSEFSLVFA